MDIYRTDAAVWSQTETTTDCQDHSNGTAYKQMAATEISESFTNVASKDHNELKVHLENLVSAFNTTYYVGGCDDLQGHTQAYKLQYILYYGVFTAELIRIAWELYGKFNTLIDTALCFICTGNKTVGHDVISMAGLNVHNFTQFMVRLNGSKTAIGDMSVRDTVADLYRNSIQRVACVKELVERLTEMISGEDKIVAMKRIIPQQLKTVNLFYECSLFEIAVGKEKNWSTYHRTFPKGLGTCRNGQMETFLNVITSGKIRRFLDAQHWAKLLEQETRSWSSFKQCCEKCNTGGL